MLKQGRVTTLQTLTAPSLQEKNSTPKPKSRQPARLKELNDLQLKELNTIAPHLGVPLQMIKDWLAILGSYIHYTLKQKDFHDFKCK